MKHLLLLVIACLLANGGVKAQEKALYECLYQYTINGTNKSGESFTETGYTMLQVGASQAKFQDYTAFALDSLNSRGNATDEQLKEYETRMLKNKNYFDQTVYQNSPTGKMTVQSVITPDYYVYEEDARPIRWTLSEKTDTVCGYLCKKATGTYGGRTWTAWYAPEIPVPFGPWKLTGLPGLVLDATDAEHIHRFTAFAFRHGASDILPLPDMPMVSITRKKFIKAKNRFEQDPIRNLPVEAINGITVQKFGTETSISVNNIPLRIRPNGYTPLETE